MMRGSREEAARLVERANAVSIFRVLDDVFGIYHPSTGRSYKGRCPFGFEHPDGGIDKGWRTYPSTNSSHCFVMHGYMNTVRLIQLREELRPVQAAKWVLRYYGLLQPVSYRKRMEELVQEHETRVSSVGSTAYLVEALHSAMSAHPEYASKQFSHQVADAMEEELERLDQVLDGTHGDPAGPVRGWYSGAKRHLTQVLEEMKDGREEEWV